MTNETTRRPPPDFGPVTVDELNERLLVLEDVATLARDMEAATRFVLGNLVLKLDRAGVVDAQEFIKGLRPGLIELETSTRWAAKLLLDDLQIKLLRRVPDESGDAPGAH